MTVRIYRIDWINDDAKEESATFVADGIVNAYDKMPSHAKDCPSRRRDDNWVLRPDEFTKVVYVAAPLWEKKQGEYSEEIPHDHPRLSRMLDIDNGVITLTEEFHQWLNNVFQDSWGIYGAIYEPAEFNTGNYMRIFLYIQSVRDQLMYKVFWQ